MSWAYPDPSPETASPRLQRHPVEGLPRNCKTPGRRRARTGRRKRRYAHDRDYPDPHRHSEGPATKIIRAVLQRRKPRSSGCSRSAVARPGRQDTVADATRREPPNLPSQASAQLTRTQRYETADCPNAEPVPPCRLRALIGVDFTASWWRADYPDLCKSGCCGAGIASGYFLARTALVRPGA